MFPSAKLFAYLQSYTKYILTNILGFWLSPFPLDYQLYCNLSFTVCIAHIIGKLGSLWLWVHSHCFTLQATVYYTPWADQSLLTRFSRQKLKEFHHVCVGIYTCACICVHSYVDVTMKIINEHCSHTSNFVCLQSSLENMFDHKRRYYLQGWVQEGHLSVENLPQQISL